MNAPRKNQRYTDDAVRAAARRRQNRESYHRQQDRRYALGLTARGTPRVRKNFPRHIHEAFVNPLESNYAQRQQAIARDLHHKKINNRNVAKWRAENIALGLTHAGKPRKRGRIPTLELQWRTIRASMNVQRPEILINVNPESRAERL